ncbi:MAG TPA: 4-(cytidine 5'-diphospho)-2-C-methyl-D-erythritol kinase [Stellaceae bacterium]|nr:4-(cytidine 5'-diphospho)-2-C-methyl-D-erythritol kinase [Stellaceae bacterium]
MTFRVFAPAKINLYLHVLGRRADGYHLLDSLIAFADIGDLLTAAPAGTMSLALGGPEAGAIAALGEDNLVMKAARLFAQAAAAQAPQAAPVGAALYLDKRLPVSSGIGGGSSDAAATLRALDRMSHRPLGPDILAMLALKLGADTPACLAARPVWVGGIGERIEEAAGLPPAGIVLANPRRTLPTKAVFTARRGSFTDTGRFSPMPRDAAGLASILSERRNDLTEAAVSLVPEVAVVLARLARLPGALLARMSGSGATCFALFSDRSAALSAGAVLARAEPLWWSAAGALMTDPRPVDATSGSPER